jgi:hypothetical protein
MEQQAIAALEQKHVRRHQNQSQIVTEISEWEPEQA